jgi:hypothetical protein
MHWHDRDQQYERLRVDDLKLTSMLDYGPFLYRRLGFSVVNQLLIQCGWITVCLLGNAFNAAVIDYFGRVRMLREYSLRPYML